MRSAITRQCPSQIAGEIGGGQEQLARVPQSHPVDGPHEAGMPVHDLGGQQPGREQLARPVQVGQDQVEQLGPLA